jgi:hypothetical protein
LIAVALTALSLWLAGRVRPASVISPAGVERQPADAELGDAVATADSV